ncbi:redoxin family protein [Bariatricus massiliensis]|uniref:Redoxin family protein n=1 Tax=Bariatricus massiliensis TaxID=1745713 RepID=A0ABS8DHA9_9FIRM|nr:TlpA disulfide reductase family protein [Bariatricus massiliensis]MCB7304449.1 redoxin family protein [Bariatricus massiliensis]MCB7375100.1 redoxin family protein [Bariatricus massiliensis]MCB7387559.1 redoxin family protein [Bariatricus massiliensis]MCB7411721.1 redoxin family protein [Bariatricus massiliensis]MCQ5253856.1 redoxin family protein [Bariatricus massiliensis]
MKRLSTLFLALGLTVSLAACGSPSASSSSSESASADSESTAPDINDMVKEDPISEEDQELMNRSVRFTADKKLSYDTWKKVMELPGVECPNHISGYIDDVSLGDNKDMLLSGEPELEENGLFVTYELTEGKVPADGSTGGCVIPASMAESMGKKVGDKVTVDTPLGKAEYEITGLYRYSEKGKVGGLTEENAPLYEIFVNTEDIVKLTGTNKDGYFLGNSVTCATAEEAKKLVEQASAILKEYDMKAMLASDSSAEMTYADSNELFQDVALDGTDLDGKALPDDLLAKDGVTMVNVWATFCNPCLEEMPYLEKLNKEFAAAGKNFKVVGIAADVINDKGKVGQEQLDLAKEIVKKTGVTYTNIIPGEKLQSDILPNVTAFPTSFFLNDKGEVIKTVMGATTKDDWANTANELLESLK